MDRNCLQDRLAWWETVSPEFASMLALPFPIAADAAR